MKVFATIHKHRARVSGYKHSGWRVVESSTPLSPIVRDVDFTIRIVDDGVGGFLLDYKSIDGQFCADSSHKSINSAFDLAAEVFGIPISAWQLSPDAKRKK